MSQETLQNPTNLWKFCADSSVESVHITSALPCYFRRTSLAFPRNVFPVRGLSLSLSAERLRLCRIVHKVCTGTYLHTMRSKSSISTNNHV